jgi:polyhydroxyalkanoate synthase
LTNKKNGNIDSAINPKLDGDAHVAWAQAWSSISPETSLLAWVDWASHLANSPGKQAELLAFAAPVRAMDGRIEEESGQPGPGSHRS